MFKEALDRIAELAVAAVKPERIDAGDPTKLTFMTPAGSYVINKPEPIRSHSVEDVESLVALANRFTEESNRPAVWVDETEARLVIDDEDYRANTVSLDLDKTAIFRRIEKLAQGEWFDQKGFIRLLRLELPGALPPGLLLDRVRRIKFENSQVISAERTKDRESLGRDLTSRINTGDELPEEVTLTAKVFRLGEPTGIVCGVDVDPSRGLFQLIPLPDEVERVKTQAVREIMGMISEDINESVPVYFGSDE